jgi:AcrR family transcriptional regulator
MSNRRKDGTGYSRGEDTRARVIASALKLFGQCGFDGASTREIAVDAGVNAPALQYYFSSKEGLYLACVEHMASTLWQHAQAAVSNAGELLLKHAPDAELIDAHCNIQDSIADFLFSPAGPADWVLLVVREQAGLGLQAAFDLMYNEVTAKFIGINSALVGRLLGVPPGAEEARVRAITLSGQLLVFQFLRRSFLTALGWDKFDGRRVSLIKRILRENTEALLTSLTRSRAAHDAAAAPKRKSKTVNRR